MLSRDWFALQLRCAERAAAIVNLPIEEALLRFTVVYLRLGLGPTFDPDAPLWREYLRGVASAGDRAAFTAAFCAEYGLPQAASPFGCFGYTHVPEEGRIRLHFVNADRSGAGPLSRERISVRRAELRALFAEVAGCCSSVRTVRGNSWLHGIAAYRRLYPPEYGASALPAPMAEEFQYMALWGQFLDHRGEIKAALARPFLAGLARARTIDALSAAVPRQVYEAECAIKPFYLFYGLPAPSGGTP